jgi:putative transcriptional regulator
LKVSTSVTRSLAILLVVLGCAAGTASATDLSQPVTLVATRLATPEFFETVLFAAPLPNGTHIGFILNQPSAVPLAAVLPEFIPASRVVDPVYRGGPVLPQKVFAAVRTPPEVAGTFLQPMPGLALVMDRDAIDRIIEKTPNDARYFTGLIRWQPGELDEEVRAGAWEVSPADASTVFSANPEALWQTLSTGGVRPEARSQPDRPRPRSDPRGIEPRH